MESTGYPIMVIDSSAVIAILLGETEASVFARSIAEAPKRLMSSFTALEAFLIIEARKGELGGRDLELLLYRTGIDIVPFTGEHLELARRAWRKFGKGRHQAGLNIGDCCSYALSVYSGEPLLFKGEDFTLTDVQSVPWQAEQSAP